MKGMTKALTLAINKLWVRLEPLPAAGGRPRALNFSEGRKTKPQRPTEKQKDRNKKTEVLWLQGQWRSIGSSPGLWRVALLSRVPPSSCCPPAHELCLGTTLLTAWAMCSTVLNVLQGFLWRRRPAGRCDFTEQEHEEITLPKRGAWAQARMQRLIPCFGRQWVSPFKMLSSVPDRNCCFCHFFPLAEHTLPQCTFTPCALRTLGINWVSEYQLQVLKYQKINPT